MLSYYDNEKYKPSEKNEAYLSLCDYSNKQAEEIKRLKQDREILKSFIVRHHPEMEGWIRKNFGRLER